MKRHHVGSPFAINTLYSGGDIDSAVGAVYVSGEELQRNVIFCSMLQ